MDEAGGRTCLVPVRAQPGARRTALAGTWNGCLKLAVAAPPEDGRANDELTALLARLFDLKPRAVELVSGATSRQKRFRLGLAAGVARTKLAALLAALDTGSDEKASSADAKRLNDAKHANDAKRVNGVTRLNDAERSNGAKRVNETKRSNQEKGR